MFKIIGTQKSVSAAKFNNKKILYISNYHQNFKSRIRRGAELTYSEMSSGLPQTFSNPLEDGSSSVPHESQTIFPE